jgi:hypothetical protein
MDDYAKPTARFAIFHFTNNQFSALLAHHVDLFRQSQPGAAPKSHGLRALLEWRFFSPVALGELHSLAHKPSRVDANQDRVTKRAA